MSLPRITAAQWLACTVALEAEGEPWAGQLAVAYTIVNRARRRKRSIEDIVFEPWQFSAWNTDGRRGALDTLSGAVWDAGSAAAEAALAGRVADPSRGADHYLNVALTRQSRRDGRLPAWAEDPARPGEVNPHLVTAVLDAHTFLRLL